MTNKETNDHWMNLMIGWKTSFKKLETDQYGVTRRTGRRLTLGEVVRLTFEETLQRNELRTK